jgi:hypothetical protein
MAEASGGPASRGYHIARGLCQREEFNRHRDRLPRSVRRDVDPVPPGHVGLLVQAITGEDVPLMAIYGHVPADIDPSGALADMERRLHSRLR